MGSAISLSRAEKKSFRSSKKSTGTGDTPSAVNWAPWRSVNKFQQLSAEPFPSVTFLRWYQWVACQTKDYCQQMGDVSGNERKVFKEKSWLSLGSNTLATSHVLSPVLRETKQGLHQEQAQRAGPSVAPPVCQPNKVPQVVKHMGCGNDGVWGGVVHEGILSL